VSPTSQLGSQNVVASAFTAALALVAGRATAAEVLALAGLDPVRVRFGITLDDLELYDRWVADLGTTWGLDAEHRADWLSVDVADGTWSATLDRVLVGAAMPAPEPARGGRRSRAVRRRRRRRLRGRRPDGGSPGTAARGA
jgi:exodeoxyribonuclease V gamma subunit